MKPIRGGSERPAWQSSQSSNQPVAQFSQSSYQPVPQSIQSSYQPVAQTSQSSYQPIAQYANGIQPQGTMLPPLDLPLYSFDMCNQRRTGNSLPSEPRATFAPLPPLGGYSVAIHPLIAYGSRWLIEHDVTQPPFSGLLISPSYSTSSQCLSENATIPGLTCLTIYFQPIDKYLVVHSADRPAVTIYDVLHSVYEAAHAAVLQRTDHHLLSPQIDGWHQGVSAQGLEARRFSKAVFQSLFNGRQRWGGLTASKSHADIWILHTK